MTPTTSPRPPPGYSLRDRLLLFTLGIVVVLVGLTLGVIDAFLRQQLHRQIAEELVTTGAVFERFLELRARWMRGQSLVVAADPRFTATLDLPGADGPSLARTVLGEARQFQGILGSQLFIVTDRRGRALARLRLTRMDTVTARRPLVTGTAWTVAGAEYRVTPVRRDGWRVAVGVVDDGTRAPWAANQIEAALDGTAPESDTEGLAAALLRAFDADLVWVAGRQGDAPALVVRHVDHGADLSGWPAVERGLAGVPSDGLLTDGGHLFHVDVVPVWSPDGLVGTLTTGFDIDDALARDLRDMTRSHVTFFGPQGHLVASTCTDSLRPALQAGLRPQATRPYEMRLGTGTYLSHVGHFGQPLQGGDPATAPQGIYLIQRSLDEGVAFLWVLEQVLIAIGGGVLLLAVALSFAAARRISRPVGALVEGTRRLAAGDLRHRIEVDSRSELGELARSFNDMADALHRSREDLEESERAYRDLFDNAQDLVLTTDLDLRIRTVNKAGLAFLGYDLDQLRDRALQELLAPEDRERAAGALSALAPGAPRPVIEATFLRRGGAAATFEIVSRWMVEAGQPVGVHAIGRDITQRRERERETIRFREQLAQAEKLRALGEMAAGVAHNFNNLLTVVVGNAELIDLNEDVPEPIRRDTRRILESARRCSAIVRRIQTFGRPIDLDQRDRVDLSQVVRDTVDLTVPKWKTGPALEGRTVCVETDLDMVPPVLSQGSAWEEILSNLIFNAVDAMPEGGTITLSTRAEGDDVVVRVADTGVGMDMETRRRIFEPFFTTKDEAAGTGLGLSTVWGLLSTLGGTVSVDSSPGRGTTFALRMPAAPAADAVGPDPAEALTTTQRRLRILVVDDEPRVLELLPPMLSGHDVVVAHGGLEGLDRVRDGGFDVVICDWVMDGASGLEVAAAAKATDAGTVFVLMTGWETGQAPPAGTGTIDLRLGKPFEREDVERAVGTATALWARRSRAT